MNENLPSNVQMDANENGSVIFATDVIATIAGLAATEVEGVTSMVGTASGGGLVDIFTRKNQNSKSLTRGVRIELSDNNAVSVQENVYAENISGREFYFMNGTDTTIRNAYVVAGSRSGSRWTTKRSEHQRARLENIFMVSENPLADFTRLAPILDFINLMGYDFNWSSLGSSHHSNLYPASVGKVISELCDDRAVRYYISQGVPSYKINIGVPYYGYVAEQGPEGFYRFDQIEHLLETDPQYERQFDEKAKQSYVTKNGVFHIAYDDERTLVEKCKYIKENHLGGLMDWTYNHDPEGQARKIVARELLAEEE